MIKSSLVFLLHFAVTVLVWILCYPTLFFISFAVVPYKLSRGWEGYDTWFGNYKYGRYGNKASPTNGRMSEIYFLCLRNPISNFGKQVLAVSSTATWPWYYDISIHLKFGWKKVENPIENQERTFLFRPTIELEK